MISIVNYRERYQSDIEALDAEMAAEIVRHADVLKDTVCVALSDGRFVGAGLIMETNPYRVSAEEEEYQYLRAEYRVIPGIEEEAEASITLLEELQYRFDRLRRKGGRKPVLRVWVRAEDTAYTELLYDEGFSVGNVMTVMKRGIDETDEWLDEEEPVMEDNRGPAYEPEPLYGDEAREAAMERGTDEPELREFYAAESEWDTYFEVNAKSFGQPDSENEMRFRLGNPDCRVWVAIADDRLVAAVSVWPLADHTYATENIFCDPSYQRRGITTRLMRFVLGKLYDEGAVCARLTVYGDNLSAIRLYRKLGYSVAYELLEMHYFGREDK